MENTFLQQLLQSFNWLEFPLKSLDLRSDRSTLTECALTIIQQFDRLASLTLNSVFDAATIRVSQHTFLVGIATTPLLWPHLTSLKLTCKINFIYLA
jgi:hypothetical protein